MSVFTLDWLKSVTLADFKKSAGKVAPGSQELADLNALLSSDEGKTIAFEMLNDPDYKPVSQRQPTEEEVAQIAADTARAEAEAAEAATVAVPTPEEQTFASTLAAAAAKAMAEREAEDAALCKEGIGVHRDANGIVVRIVQDYQVLGENDHPIGRPTHLEARSWPELVLKQKTAHENAVRYAERVKSSKFKSAAIAMQGVESNQAVKAAQEESAKLAEEAVKEQDPAKMKEAVKKSVQAEREAQAASETARSYGQSVAQLWMDDHTDDFVACQASSTIIGGWLTENNLPVSYENLESAFQACKHQLPKPEIRVEVPVAPVDNPPVAAPVAPVAPPASIPPVAPPAAAVTPSAATPPVTQPAAKAPAATPVAAVPNPPAARRPGVNGSLAPGSMSIARPTVVAQPTATRAELLHAINKMSREEYRKKLHDANYVKQLQAAGIPVIGTRT